LQEQYANIDISTLTKQNIDFLKADTTFTITTGHQLNCLAVLVFFYKIIMAPLTKELKGKYPTHNFVPFIDGNKTIGLKINYFNFKGKKNFVMEYKSTGPVGRLSTEGLSRVLRNYQQG
jgi:hypothetical protein